MSALRRLLYISRAVSRAGDSLLSAAEIIGESERNNRRDRLSGLLLFHDGWFLQVLEGAQADLDLLMTRLKRDPRHTDIQVLASEPTDSREFGQWSMAQARITPSVTPLLRDLRIDGLTPTAALGLLRAARPA